MISIILPAYNEEKAIKQSIDKINEVMNRIKKYPYEVIVIDDGSYDKTYEHAKKTNAKVIKNPHNLGYGISLKKCIEAAKYETLIICDADLSYPVDAIPDLIKKKEEGYDMVVGQRTGKFYKESPIKFPFRIILRFLVEYVAERKIPDINSGLRIFDKGLAMKYFSHLCDTFSFTTSLTLAYMMNGKFVHYIPIKYFKREGTTKVKLLRDSIRTFQYIIEAVIFYNPMKMFMLLSFFLIIIGFFLLLFGAFTSLNIFYILGVSSIIISILTVCMGFLAVLLKQIMLKK